MSKSAPEIVSLRWFLREMHTGETLKVWLNILLLGLLLNAQPSLAQHGGTLGFTRVPVGTTFDQKVMPFRSAEPLQSYGAIGKAPWITLEYAGKSGAKTFLRVATMRLHPSASGQSEQMHNVAALPPEASQRKFTAQDVRTLWTDRRVLTAWLDFDSATESLRKRLEIDDPFPVGTHIQALVENTYAIIQTNTDGSTKVVLKTVSGKTIVPEAPTPIWVEPLFHDIFIACIGVSRPSNPPLPKAIFGKRYETNRRCGLMNAEGRWLAKPEFEFMENIHGAAGYLGQGPFLLLLRGDEPCISTMHSPVAVACLGQPISSLFSSGRLAFAIENLDNQRRGGDAIGYLAPNGSWAISPSYRECQAFSGSIATVQRAGFPGVIDRAGKWLTPQPPDDPVAMRWLVEMGGDPNRIYGSGLINREGRMIIPTMFPKVEPVDENRFRVCHQNGCDLIQVTKAPGPGPTQPIQGTISAQAIQAAANWIPTAENDKWGFQNIEGQWVLKPQFGDAEPFENGLAKAKSMGHWGILKPTGKWLHPPEFNWISSFSYGVAIAEELNGNSVLLRVDGKRIQFSNGKILGPFTDDGLAVAGFPHNDKVGFIDRNGEWVVLPRYSSAQPFTGNYAIVSGRLPDDWRPPNFKEMPYILRSIHWLSSDVVALRAWVGREERVGLMDKDGNWMLPTM